MTKKFNSIIDELRHYLNLQLEADLSKDKDLYNQLESKILELGDQL